MGHVDKKPVNSQANQQRVWPVRMPLRPDSENRKREKRMQEIGSKKSEAKKHGAPASIGEGGAGKKLAADPAKRIAATDEEIPVRVYFRPGANMPGRREVLSWSQQAESVCFGRHAPKTRPWKAVAVRRGDGGARTEKPEQADRTGGSAPARSPPPRVRRAAAENEKIPTITQFSAEPETERR